MHMCLQFGICIQEFNNLKNHNRKIKLITWSNSLTFRPLCNNSLLNHRYSWSWGITKRTDVRSIIKSELKLDQILVRHLSSTSKTPPSSPAATSPEKSSHTKPTYRKRALSHTYTNLKTAKTQTGHPEERGNRDGIWKQAETVIDSDIALNKTK